MLVSAAGGGVLDLSGRLAIDGMLVSPGVLEYVEVSCSARWGEGFGDSMMSGFVGDFWGTNEAHLKEGCRCSDGPASSYKENQFRQMEIVISLTDLH